MKVIIRNGNLAFQSSGDILSVIYDNIDSVGVKEIPTKYPGKYKIVVTALSEDTIVIFPSAAIGENVVFPTRVFAGESVTIFVDAKNEMQISTEKQVKLSAYKVKNIDYSDLYGKGTANTANKCSTFNASKSYRLDVKLLYSHTTDFKIYDNTSTTLLHSEEAVNGKEFSYTFTGYTSIGFRTSLDGAHFQYKVTEL